MATTLWVRAVGWGLATLHAGLALWALVGFAEMLVDFPPWPRVSNPQLPTPVLFLQWLFVLAAATVFLAGYFRRWRLLPQAMTAAYAAMAALCAAETFGFLVHDGRFLAMGVEYVAYLAILIFLYRTRAALSA